MGVTKRTRSNSSDPNPVRSIRIGHDEWAEITQAAKYASLETGSFVKTAALKEARRLNREARK
jgi:uncharacterized protein (DUF1778 family)